LRLLLAAASITLACPGPAEDVTIGSKQFPESEIIGEIMVQLATTAGAKAEHKKQMGGTKILWEALKRGDIDAYPEYTGTIIQEILPPVFKSEAGGTQAEWYEEDLRTLGIRATKPLGFNNTYALGMKSETAAELGIESISDLRQHPNLAFGLSNEFMSRADGWPGLKRSYGLPQTNVRGLKHELAYGALNSGKIALTDLYSTDAEIAKYGLLVLKDDREYFPRYDAVILYREGLDPKAVASFKKLEGAIDEAKMIAMNSAVSVDGKSAGSVAKNFLSERLQVQSTSREKTRAERIVGHGLEHLKLVVISLIAAIVVAIPLGILAFRSKAVGQIVLAVVGVIQTIPSLALLVFLIPLMGIGETPAIFALFLYSLLPIVRNTYSGLHDIPGPIRDSAAALGLGEGQRLRLVYLPMAARSILAGIKTSAVINVGTATLGALIGAGGFGEPIITGLTLNNIGLVLEGAIPAAALALIVQGIFEFSDRFFVH